MARSESPSVSVSRRGLTSPGSDTERRPVVWVRGEHDIATKVALVVAIARAAQRDDDDVLVDLSGVTFMDASTIGALVGSLNRLRPRSQSIEVRSPSPPALRVLEVCGLAHLVHPAAVEAVHPTGAAAALSTWVDIPVTQLHETVVHADAEEGPFEEGQPLRSMRPTADAQLSHAGATIEVDRGGP